MSQFQVGTLPSIFYIPDFVDATQEQQLIDQASCKQSGLACSCTLEDCVAHCVTLFVYSNFSTSYFASRLS
jgi:hypothetical protein